MNCQEKSISENFHRTVIDNGSVNIVTDIVFWQYITLERNTKVANRFTKAQAFCDLLAQYCQQVKMTDGTQLPTLDYSLLARRWNWSRNVVRDFIAHLIGFNIITVASHARGFGFKNFALENIRISDVQDHGYHNASQGSEIPKDGFRDHSEAEVPP